MKTLIVAVLAFSYATAAHAQVDIEGPNCDGVVVRSPPGYVALDPLAGELCSPKWVTPANSRFAKRILRTCPVGTHCHVEGSYSNHGIEAITRVKKR
jgi:hypothetical protein